MTSAIQEIRKALQDNAKSPQCVETVHKRGFRFIASVAAAATPVPSADLHVPSQKGVSTPSPGASRPEPSANGQGGASEVERQESTPVTTFPSHERPLTASAP